MEKPDLATRVMHAELASEEELAEIELEHDSSDHSNMAPMQAPSVPGVRAPVIQWQDRSAVPRRVAAAELPCWPIR
jgi:hypothetical protein